MKSEVEDSGPEFPEDDFKRFIEAHINAENELQDASDGLGGGTFCVSWWRRVVQDLQSFEIAQKIADGRPWSTDSPPASWDGKFDLYARWPASHRRPDLPLSLSEEGGVAIRAAQECMSLYWGDVDGVKTGKWKAAASRHREIPYSRFLPGVLLVDMIRQHRIHRVRASEHGSEAKSEDSYYFTPCFLAAAVCPGQQGKQPNESGTTSEAFRKTIIQNSHPSFKCRREREEEPTPGSPLCQFVKALVEAESSPQCPAKFARSIIAHMVCQDLSDLLRSISSVLDCIEWRLHDDVVLQSAMPAWRGFLGTWRNASYHQSALFERLIDWFPPENTKESVAALKLEQNLRRVKGEVDRLSKRMEATFQALMSSITIVESSRAVKQAEMVTKLTQLAFFFIPLSLVAGAFGMNINVSAVFDALQARSQC